MALKIAILAKVESWENVKKNDMSDQLKKWIDL
jgi:hypothetical protein